MELDTSCFKAFQFAVKSLNFTEAAKASGMTQSGVSQHIAKLEKDLGIALFLRVGKKVHLTEAGKTLLSFIERHQEQTEALYESLHTTTTQLRGLVRYAMPESCLLSPHFSLLLKDKAKNFPGVDLKVNLHHSEEVIRQVLAHEIDFGFVTRKTHNEDLNYENFCEEEYVLVAHKNSPITARNISEANWITYPGFESIAERWVADQVWKSKSSQPCFNFSGETNGLKAALMMASHGMGMTILPRHCIDSYEHKKDLKIINEGFKRSANTIYIVNLKTFRPPARVEKVIEVFREMK